MLCDLESGKINCCAVKDLSRLGRNAIDTGYYIEKFFPTNGIRFIAVNDDYDSANGYGGGIALSLKNMINEAYALDIGRKTKAVKQLHIKEGAFIGKVPPYGYMKSAEDSHVLVPDEETAPVVSRIFQMYYDGASIAGIHDFLNDNEILPPYRYFCSRGWTSEKDIGKNTRWNFNMVNGILRKRIYCGDMVQGKYERINQVLKSLPKDKWVVTPNTHKSLIDREVFAEIQRKLDVKRPCKSGSHSNPSKNLFLGKIVCGHCGYALQRKRKMLVCNTGYSFGQSDCLPVSINEQLLKETLFAVLQKQIAVFADRKKSKRKTATGERINGYTIENRA